MVLSTYKRRFDARYDEMKWLFAELYDNDMNAFAYFCKVLEKAYKNRPAALKRLDEERAGAKDWFRDQSLMGMQMYTECFAGDIKGIQSHFDYIKECGIRYLHVMPLLASPDGASDGGYAVSDFRRIKRKFGSMKDLYQLTTMCHENDMAVCLDFVLNHTSDQHIWAKKAKAGEKEYMDRYFFFDDWTIPNQFEETLPEVFPETAPGSFTWCEEAGKVVMTSFHRYQWDLNYGNPTVFNDMTDNMLNLCNHGVDIIRLDAIPYIWKTLGTNCRNLPQVHNLTRLLRIAAEIVAPSVMLLGEVVMEPDKVVPYFGSVEKPECHMLYNVTTMATTWHTVATRDVRLMKHQLNTVFSLPKKFVFLNYLRCHDDIGWGLDYDYLSQFGINEAAHKKYLNEYLKGDWEGSLARGELYNNDPLRADARLCGTTASLCGIEAAEAAGDMQKLQAAIDLDIMLHSFLLTLSGIPIIYSGDEIGFKNDYSYHNDPEKYDDSRYVHRGRFPWDEAVLKEESSSRQGKIFKAIMLLKKIRSEEKVFAQDADIWVHETGSDHVLGIGRCKDGQQFKALFNFGDNSESVWLSDDRSYTDMVTGEEIGDASIQMASHEFRWLLVK